MTIRLADARLSRRQLLADTAASAAAGWLTTSAAWAAPEPRTIAFFVVGDTHYLADKEMPSRLQAASAETCGRLVDTLNRLPGTEIPAAAGGGRVAQPLGVIHAGDVIDTGDKQGGVTAEMQRTEWAAFADDYGLAGGDGRLKWPVFEVHGNHDAPHGRGLAIDQIIARNRRRPGVSNVSASGVNYSWDWGGVHFINLGLVVGSDRSVDRPRRFAPLDSLEFLQADLREKVGDQGRPVIITHHLNIAGFSTQCDAAAATTQTWDPCDLRAFHAALRDYKVAAIFYGHTHARNVFRWDGVSAKAAAGVPVFNTDNASHFGGDAQAFFYVEVDGRQVLVREYQTQDRWQTGSFTPQTWSTPLPA